MIELHACICGAVDACMRENNNAGSFFTFFFCVFAFSQSANRGAGGVSDQDQQQQKILADAKTEIAHQAFLMKRALDNNKIMEAINHASFMVSELRTSFLNPQEYYELCL